jgi:drug/metabolite transporter (DMT)-like permease
VTAARRRLLPWIALGVIYVVWGSTYFAIRVLVREIPPMAAAGVRFLVAGLVMAAIAAVADRAHPRPTRRQLLDYALAGVLLLAVGNGLVMWSEKSIPSGIAALIVGTVPVWLTLFDGFRPTGQRWSVRVWTGTLIGLVGVLLVARPQGGIAPGHWPAVLALQVATLAWTAGTLYAQSVTRRLPLFSAAAVEMIAGSIALFALSALVGEDTSRFAAASPAAWASLAYLTVFGSLVGFTAFAFCINELPASTVGTYAYVNPVVAVFLGAMFLGERVTPGLLTGGILILVAVVITTMSRRAAAAKAAPTPAPPPSAVAERA